MLLLLLASLLLLLHGARGSPLRGSEGTSFDREKFCTETSAGAAARFCGSREFAERGEITSDTVAMVAEREARDAARKACDKSFDVVALSEPAATGFNTEAKGRAKAVADETAQRLCEQMSLR